MSSAGSVHGPQPQPCACMHASMRGVWGVAHWSSLRCHWHRVRPGAVCEGACRLQGVRALARKGGQELGGSSHRSRLRRRRCHDRGAAPAAAVHTRTRTHTPRTHACGRRHPPSRASTMAFTSATVKPAPASTTCVRLVRTNSCMASPVVLGNALQRVPSSHHEELEKEGDTGEGAAFGQLRCAPVAATDPPQHTCLECAAAARPACLPGRLLPAGHHLLV